MSPDLATLARTAAQDPDELKRQIAASTLLLKAQGRNSRLEALTARLAEAQRQRANAEMAMVPFRDALDIAEFKLALVTQEVLAALMTEVGNGG